MINERVGRLRQRIDKAKKLPAMARALAAEPIIEELGAILELMGKELERQGQQIRALNKGGSSDGG